MEVLKYVFNVFNRYIDDKIRYLSSGYIGKFFFLIIVLPLSIVATCGFVFLAIMLWDNINSAGPENKFIEILRVVAMFAMVVFGIAFVFSTGVGLLQNAVISYRTGKDRGRVTEVIRITKTEKTGDKENKTVTEISPKNTARSVDYLYMLGCIILFIAYIFILINMFKW